MSSLSPIPQGGTTPDSGGSISFNLGRSEFDKIQPGTKQLLDYDSAWGRIQSVESKLCLDLEPDTVYPVDKECNEINDNSVDQAWHYSSDGFLHFLDINKEYSNGYRYDVCLYGYGNSEDGGFVRIHNCPSNIHNSESEPIENAEWIIIKNEANPFEYKLKSKIVGLCMGEEIVSVKAGKPGKPGPARVKFTWQMVECKSAPWWNFLYLFENYDLSERLCKMTGDEEHCILYKNRNRKLPIGLQQSLISADSLNLNGFARSGPRPAVDYSNYDTTDEEDDYEYDPELYEMYKSMYEYYLTGDFDPYDYDGYGLPVKGVR